MPETDDTKGVFEDERRTRRTRRTPPRIRPRSSLRETRRGVAFFPFRPQPNRLLVSNVDVDQLGSGSGAVGVGGVGDSEGRGRCASQAAEGPAQPSRIGRKESALSTSFRPQPNPTTRRTSTQGKATRRTRRQPTSNLRCCVGSTGVQRHHSAAPPMSAAVTPLSHAAENAGMFARCCGCSTATRRQRLSANATSAAHRPGAKCRVESDPSFPTKVAWNQIEGPPTWRAQLIP